MFHVASKRSALSAGHAISVDTRAIFPAAAKAWRQLNKVLFDTYRPELHYMRGPGPKWREKRGALIQCGRPTGQSKTSTALNAFSDTPATCSALTQVTPLQAVLQ